VTKKDKPAKHRSMLKGRVRLIVILTIVLFVVAAGSVYYLVFILKPPARGLDPNNQFVQGVSRLQQQPVPDDPIQKAVFYAQLAQNYDGYGDKRNALNYFLKAQKVIDDNKLGDQIVYYQAIADEYQSLGDRPNARVYMQLQLQYLQTFAQTHPDDPGTKDAIDAANKRIESL
jgi:flagellar basal body-associated protein FliL